MPHISLEYSQNLEAAVDIKALCRALRDAAAGTGIFPPAGIRVRATACSHSVIADGDAGHGFIDITVRIGGGRDTAAKSAAADAIFAAAERFTEPHMAKHPFMLSLELREMDAATNRKASSIRDYLPPDMA